MTYVTHTGPGVNDWIITQTPPTPVHTSNPPGTNWALPVDERSEALNESVIKAYKKQLERNIFHESPLMEILKNKEHSMSDSDIARKAIEKRKEERAERLAEEIGDYFETSSWSDGDTASWKVTFHETPDKTYSYVAVRGGSNWFITGDSVRHTTDSLVMKIIELNLRGVVTDAAWDD